MTAILSAAVAVFFNVLLGMSFIRKLHGIPWTDPYAHLYGSVSFRKLDERYYLFRPFEFQVDIPFPLSFPIGVSLLFLAHPKQTLLRWKKLVTDWLRAQLVRHGYITTPQSEAQKAEQAEKLKLDEAQLEARKAEQTAQIVAQRKLIEKREKLHEALARLEVITDQVFSQSQLRGSEHLHPGPSTQIPLEQSLRLALADVSRCLTECRDVSYLGQIPNDVLNHENGIETLRAELAATFGYQDL